MNKIFRIFTAAALFAGVSVACTDLSDFEDRIDSLEGRVTALETQIKGLNGNIEALQQLVAGGTVNSATNNNGVWTLVLTNGETLTLTQGSIGVGNAPVMSVDKDGYWMVDYGTGATYVLIDGNKVKAIGTDGKTPMFGVDANGFWTVSYDDGKTYTQVKGADGNPVSALPQGDAKDPYFEDVKLVDGNLEVTLRGGEKITVPVLTDFLCAIENEGLQLFAPGETKPFNVTLKGVKSTMITAPAGWNAALSEAVEGKAVLTVTAPKGTKSTIADSGADVTILAFSEQNYAAISKIQVQLTDAPVVFNPVANVTAGEATETALTYNVATSDATSWKYICQKEGDAAPDAAKIAAEGTEGTGTSVTIEGLESGTAYVLYVLPINGTIQGNVASAKNTTNEAVVVITDLYQAYMDGMEIEIAGVKYSKAVNGDPVLLSATEALTDIRASLHQKNGIIFLEASEGASFLTSAITEIKGGDLVIVGRHTDKEVVLTPDKFFKFVSGGIVLSNLTIDMIRLENADGNDGYFINNSGTMDLSKMHIDNCKVINIQKNVYATGSVGCKFAVNSIRIVNSDFELIVTGNVQMFTFHNTSVLDKFGEIIFDNNIVCNQEAGVCQVFNWGQNTAQTGTVWNTKVSFCNNTLYNAPSGNGHFKFYNVGSLKMTKNLLWGDPASTQASYMFILYDANETGDGIEVSDNIAYGLASGKNWTLAHDNSTYKPENNILKKLESDPLATVDFATYTFTPTAEYASYGAQR